MARRQLYLDHLQWNAPSELPHASLDVAQLAEDDLARSDPVGNPALSAFDRVKNGIEASTQIGQHMVMIERRAVDTVVLSRRISYQH